MVIGFILLALNKFGFVEGHYNVLLNNSRDLTYLARAVLLFSGEEDLFEKLPGCS